MIGGLAVISAYLIAHGTYGGGRETGTAATLALVAVFMWILVCLSRPFAAWKTALIGAMGLIVAAAFMMPAGRTFFQFDLPAELAWWSLGVGLVGALAVEVVFRTYAKPTATT